METTQPDSARDGESTATKLPQGVKSKRNQRKQPRKLQLKNELAATKAKLKEAQLMKDGSEKDEEIAALKKRIHDEGKDLEDMDEEAPYYSDLDPDEVKQEPQEPDRPVPGVSAAGEQGSSDRPVMLDDDPSAGIMDTDSDMPPLLTPENFRAELGLGSGGKPIAQRILTRGTQLLMQYGPRNACRFRFMSESDAGIFNNDDELPDITDPAHRRANEKHGKVYKYSSRDVECIQGVVWMHESDGDGLEQIDPSKKMQGKRFPHTYVLVKWKTDSVKTWEPRSEFARVWSKNKRIVDKAIFMAASTQEKRYQEHINGTRPEKDRSPTVDPDVQNLKDQTPAPSSVNSKQQARAAEPLSTPAEFKQDWCAGEGLDPNELSAEADAKRMNAWKKYKNMYIDNQGS